MKQLSALGARRHAFFRSPRRMRPLVDRLEPGELIPNGPFSFYGGECGLVPRQCPRALRASLDPGGSAGGTSCFLLRCKGEVWRVSQGM